LGIAGGPWRLALLAVALGLGAAAAVVAQNFDNVQVTSEKVADGIWALKGRGGNIGLFAGAEGVVLIDDQFAPLSPKIKAAIKALTDHPVDLIINTHWHGDHTGGNENFARDGVKIIAHDNVRKRMSEVHIFSGVRHDTVPPSPPMALPILTYADGVTVHLNGEEVSVVHVPPAHTDGDSYIWFHHANVIHTGDLCFNGFYPFIDASSGGTIDGMIGADDRILAIADDRTRIIPGHGPLTDKAGLKHFRDMLAEVRGRVAKQLAAGRSAEQLIASHPTADLDSIWGKGPIKPDVFLTGVYEDLSKHGAVKP
jgi:glyoxylase-like metal-dependent hydrolase (beta-lactamase superfamily II)